MAVSKMCVFWLLLLEEVFFGFNDVDSIAMVPGRGCGTDTPIQLVKEINAETSLEDLECSIIQNFQSYQKFFKEKSLGKEKELSELPNGCYSEQVFLTVVFFTVLIKGSYT